MNVRHGASATDPGELAALVTEMTGIGPAAAAREAGEILSRPGPRPADGSHLARWLRAERRGLISRAELAAALGRLDVVTADVTIPDGAR